MHMTTRLIHITSMTWLVYMTNMFSHMWRDSCTWVYVSSIWHDSYMWRIYITYGVATVSRIDQIISLFLQNVVSFAKETYNFIDPTNQSHPICDMAHAHQCMSHPYYAWHHSFIWITHVTWLIHMTICLTRIKNMTWLIIYDTFISHMWHNSVISHVWHICVIVMSHVWYICLIYNTQYMSYVTCVIYMRHI